MCSRRRTVLLLFTALVAASSPVLAQRLPFESGTDTAPPAATLPLPEATEPVPLPLPVESLPPPPILSAPQPPGTQPPSTPPTKAAATAPAVPPTPAAQPGASQSPSPPASMPPAATAVPPAAPAAAPQPPPASTQTVGTPSDPGGASALGLPPSSDMNAATYNWTKQATQDAFAFEAAAARDRKLAEWCDTGFAPAHLCARRRPKEDQAQQQPAQMQVPPQQQPQRPLVDVPMGDPYSKEITIWGDTATAVLVYPDGSTQTVRQHDTLADGATVVSMSVRDGVKVRRTDGKVIALRRNRNAAPPTYPTSYPGQPGMPTPVPPPASSLLNQPFQR